MLFSYHVILRSTTYFRLIFSFNLVCSPLPSSGARTAVFLALSVQIEELRACAFAFCEAKGGRACGNNKMRKERKERRVVVDTGLVMVADTRKTLPRAWANSLPAWQAPPGHCPSRLLLSHESAHTSTYAHTLPPSDRLLLGNGSQQPSLGPPIVTHALCH